MSEFERGYRAGYRAALGAAAAECRKHAEALDHGGNTYTRHGDAIRLSCAVLALSVPAISEAAAPSGECTLRDKCDCIGACKYGFAGNGALPGMWEEADFTGGDPDERSYSERQVCPNCGARAVSASSTHCPDGHEYRGLQP